MKEHRNHNALIIKDPFSKLFTLVLLVYPLFCNYDFIGISPIFLFCLIEVILAIMSRKGSDPIQIDKRVFIYIVYMLISATVGISNSEHNSLYTIVIKCTLYILFFFVFYIFAWQVIDLEYATGLYTKIAAIVSILVIIQFGFSLIGRGFSLVLPGIPLADGDGATSDYVRMTQITTNRFSSVFMEPAHQCEYVIPCLAIQLFRESGNKRINKNLFIAVLLTIGCICTTSTIGILSSVIIWGFWALTIMKQKGAKGFLYLLILVPVISGLFFFLLRFDYVSENILKRLAVLNVRNSTVSEGFRRVRYGWVCYGDMDLLHKLFGAGYKNFGYYIAKIGTGYRIYRTNDIQWISYTNGITGMLIGLGLVGTILNLRIYMWDLILSKKLLVYGLLLSWALIMISSNSFDDPVAMTPIVIAMSLTIPKDYNKRAILINV